MRFPYFPYPPPPGVPYPRLSFAVLAVSSFVYGWTLMGEPIQWYQVWDKLMGLGAEKRRDPPRGYDGYYS
ncbi:hypothetical protein Tsubulata_003918 [Turnera subulata]|uniref:Uncharacterized protein n=1 Tax=Turnera subulata TaxID=218843 RepID=A0A9Q0GI24_9ROSI|nr:hypothetical protein Tsubulata_003918 [Turnera subulata]